VRSRLVLWGSRSGDVQVGSREDRRAQGWADFVANIHRLGLSTDDDLRLEPWQEKFIHRWYGEWPNSPQFRSSGKVRMGER
jgi:hypothetical protein